MDCLIHKSSTPEWGWKTMIWTRQVKDDEIERRLMKLDEHAKMRGVEPAQVVSAVLLLRPWRLPVTSLVY